MTQTEPRSAAAAGLRRAAAELRAAQHLLLDPELPSELARPHLDRARAELDTNEEVTPRGEARNAALAELRGLQSACEARARELDPTAFVRARRLRRGLAFGLMLAPALVFAGLRLHDARAPWRAAYYAAEDYSGDAVLRWEHGIDHNWGSMAPLDDLPADHFSVRWETCLVLAHEAELEFQVSSDDGTRLIVDGEQIVDNSGVHKFRSRAASVRLAPGVHHLKLRYHDHTKVARVVLIASIDGAAPGPIPRALLRRPGDAADPCPAGEG